MLNGEAYGTEKCEEVLIKFSEESHVIVKGEGRAKQCAVVDEEEGVGELVVSPQKHVFDDERQVQRWQDRAERVALGNTIVAAIDVGRGQAIPKIGGGAAVEKVGDKRRNFTIETQFGEEGGDDAVVHGWEELGNIQSEDGGVEAAVPIAGDDVHEDDAYVSSDVLANSSKLPQMEEVVGDSVELEVLGEDFGEKLAQGVEQRDGAERFG